MSRFARVFIGIVFWGAVAFAQPISGRYVVDYRPVYRAPAASLKQEVR